MKNPLHPSLVGHHQKHRITRMCPEVGRNITEKDERQAVNSHKAIARSQTGGICLGTWKHGVHHAGHTQAERHADGAVHEELTEVLFKGEGHLFRSSANDHFFYVVEEQRAPDGFERLWGFTVDTKDVVPVLEPQRFYTFIHLDAIGHLVCRQEIAPPHEQDHRINH